MKLLSSVVGGNYHQFHSLFIYSWPNGPWTHWCLFAQSIVLASECAHALSTHTHTHTPSEESFSRGLISRCDGTCLCFIPSRVLKWCWIFRIVRMNQTRSTSFIYVYIQCTCSLNVDGRDSHSRTITAPICDGIGHGDLVFALSREHSSHIKVVIETQLKARCNNNENNNSKRMHSTATATSISIRNRRMKRAHFFQ